MNFMGYGKATGTRFPIRPIGTPMYRNAYVPDKFWAQSKNNNQHDLFFKPQQEDLEENGDVQTNIPQYPGDDTLLTIKATSFFNHEESSLYLVITEGRGNACCEVGIAAIDIKSPELILSQISDNFWYTGLLTKIAILCPSEILLPQALIGSSNISKLYLYIKSTYPDLPIKAVPRRQFNDKKALEIIDRIHNSKYQSIRNMIAKKYYALTAASALLQYLEYILNYNFAPNSLKIRYDSKDGCMMIDLDTSHHLELLYPTCKTKERQACLFGVLNFCVTNIGKRNLRAQILQPSCQLEQITKTQECIKELSENQELFVLLERLLMKFQSVDKLMKFAVLNVNSDIPNASETMIGQALQLKICLENVPEMLHALSTINNSYFDDFRAVLSSTSYRQMLDQINRVIHPDIQITTGTSQFFQRLHALNPKISSYLDLNRENYAKLVDKMSEIIVDLSVTYNQPFRMKFITSKGFHIQLALSKGGQLPSLDPSLEVMSTTKNTVNLTTYELRMLNVRMFDVVQQIHMESNRLISELINGIRQNMSHLYDLAGFISSLDIMLSLAKYSINSNGCCPSFSSEMNVVDGIHPLLEHNRTKTTPVPNGVIANNEYHFFVITGPNMGGKTVYLKMIAVLQIIAQLGCFVPAKTAQFRLTDKILSRIGFSDRIECNLSGFVLEMRETEYIFKNITPNSLVIIDELCRSTNPEEGEVLAWDICERFVRLIGVSNDGQYLDEAEPAPAATSKSSNKSINLCSITSPFIFFVTHFDSITKLQDKFLSVVNLHFSASEEVIDGKVHLTYSYRIEDGVNKIKNYGISLAQYMNFPSDVITKATYIAEQLRQKQLPAANGNSNLLLNNSSINKRSLHRSTLLETSTSEQSQILRLFYNLYADMNSINRMAIIVEEKTEILNRKMTEVQDELPSHILEIAKQGNLFEMFKPSQRVPASNVHTSPAVTINEESHHDRTDSNVPDSNTDTNGSTHFSLLSQHSIDRRIGNNLRERYNIRTPLLSPELSNLQIESQHESFERSFRNNELQNVLPDFELNFDDRRSVENEFTTSYDVVDRNTNNMASGMNFMAKGLTQYFSNLSPREGGMVVRHERVTEEFVYSPVFRLKLKEPVKVRDNRILKTPPKNSRGLPRTRILPKRKLTTSELKEKTARKVNFSSVDTDESCHIRTSSARSSGSLTDSHEKPFQLNLTQFCSAEAINERPFFDSTKDWSVTDRRSLSSTKQKDITPVNPPRTQFFHTFDEHNISNLTAVPPQDDFMLQYDKDFSHQSGNVIDSDMSQEYSESYKMLSESNKLNFEQFQTPEDICHQSNQLNFEQFEAPNVVSHKSNQLNFEQSPEDIGHQSNQLNFEQFEAPNVVPTNQLNFEQFETPKEIGHQSNKLNFEQFEVTNVRSDKSKQMNFKHFETTKTVSSSALQFIQHAYESHSDTDSGDSDNGLLELANVLSDNKKTVYASRSDYQDVPYSSEVISNSPNPKVSTILQNKAVPCSDNIRVTEEPLMDQLQNASTETKCSGKLNDKSLDDNENLDDLIIPAPPQFL